MGLAVMDNRSHYHHEDLTTYAVELRHGDFPKNETDEENANLLYLILTTLFGAIIAVSNLVALASSIVTVHKSTKPKLIYLLLGSIALADICTGIVVIFWQLFPDNLRNQQICAAEIGLMVTSTLVTIYTVGIIGIDRFLYIFYGFHHQKRIYSRIIKSSIIIIWIFSLLIGYLPLMGWSRPLTNKQKCCFVLIVPEKLILILAISYLIPVAIILILYSAVSYRAYKKVSIHELLVGQKVSRYPQRKKFQKGNRQMIQEKAEGNSKNILLKMYTRDFSPVVNSSKRWKAVKVVLFSTNNFLVTWFPYIAVSLYYSSICPDNSTKKCRSLSLVLASPLAMLGFVNSLVSPIIYAWWHKGFNKYIKRRISTFRLRNPSHSKKIVPNASSNATLTTALENSNEHITSV